MGVGVGGTTGLCAAVGNGVVCRAETGVDVSLAVAVGVGVGVSVGVGGTTGLRAAVGNDVVCRAETGVDVGRAVSVGVGVGVVRSGSGVAIRVAVGNGGKGGESLPPTSSLATSSIIKKKPISAMAVTPMACILCCATYDLNRPSPPTV